MCVCVWLCVCVCACACVCVCECARLTPQILQAGAVKGLILTGQSGVVTVRCCYQQRYLLYRELTDVHVTGHSVSGT